MMLNIINGDMLYRARNDPGIAFYRESGIGSWYGSNVFVSLIGGCWMGLKAIGGLFQSIALPFAHTVDAARAVMMGSGFRDIATDFYWVLGYAIIFFVLGIICFR